MSSIIKSPFISFSDQKKTIEVISNNDAKIINPNSHNEPIHNEDVVDEPFDIEDSSDFTDEEIEEDIGQTPEQIAEEIVAKAHSQAEAIINQAKENLEMIENDAYEKGYEEGYTKGQDQALKEVEEVKQKLNDEINLTIQERHQLIDKTQPLVAEIIQKLVRNMVGIQKFEPEVILFLIKMGLEEVDIHGDLVIKVSHEDFDEVIKHKEHLTENMSEKISFEVLKDPKLKKNDCIIDTSLGSVNCSLDERMEGLLRQLKLIELSFYTNEDEA